MNGQTSYHDSGSGVRYTTLILAAIPNAESKPAVIYFNLQYPRQDIPQMPTPTSMDIQ